MSRQPLDSQVPLQDYALFGGRCLVEGWLDDGAITSTLALCAAQQAASIRGPAVEIGVHHGLYFILLALVSDGGLAIDVFEDQHLNVDGSGLGDRARFEANLARHHPDPGRIRIEKADSLTLSADILRDWLGGRAPTLFSIDGGHTARHAHADLRLATAACDPGAVIVVDDFENPAWPGVRRGVEQFYAESDSVWRPLALGNNKLFVVHADHHAHYAKAIEAAAESTGAARPPEPILGESVRRVDFGDPWQLVSEDTRGRLADAPENRAYRVEPQARPVARLYSGWSPIEAHGVWSDGERARLGVLRGRHEGDWRLSLRLHAFASKQAGPLSVAVRSGATELARWRFDDDASCDRSLVLPPGEPGWVDLDFEFIAPRSPAAIGLSPDARELGIALEALHVEPV